MTNLCLNGAVRKCALVAAAMIVAVFQCYSRAVAQGTPPTLTILHSFGDGSVVNDGQSPYAALIQGLDGNFYGATPTGGSHNFGSVFRITPSGTVTILHSFLDGSVPHDGQSPYAGLILGPDGNFYGTTTFGGSRGFGSVFRITPSGAVTILHSFGDVANDGAYPTGDLVLGPDGYFYGTTSFGGSTGNVDPYGNGYGAVFKMSPSGTVTILHSFGDGSVAGDGAGPQAGLVLGSDGNFYGTTIAGGSTASRTSEGYGIDHRYRRPLL
jgi:uncharacterized repeat protein (TIGR03803 family)